MGGGTNILYRNRGDGTFEDVSLQSGIAVPRGPAEPFFVSDQWIPTGSYGLGVAAADFDNDGWPDIYVACDSVPSRFYHNKGNGTFEEVGRGDRLCGERERRHAGRHGRCRRGL